MPAVLHCATKGIIIRVTRRPLSFLGKRMIILFEIGGIKMAQITKDTVIGDILDMDESTAPFFLEMGMHCLGCPASRGESVEEACQVHGVDADELVKKINAHLAGK